MGNSAGEEARGPAQRQPKDGGQIEERPDHARPDPKVYATAVQDAEEAQYVLTNSFNTIPDQKGEIGAISPKNKLTEAPNISSPDLILPSFHAAANNTAAPTSNAALAWRPHDAPTRRVYK